MRPVSPFLTVYRPQFTSIYSILERVTGIFLVLGVIVYIYSLKIGVLYMSSYGVYSMLFTLFKSSGVMVEGLLVFLLLSFFYHFYFGLRYIYWDKSGGRVGWYPMELESVYKSGYILTGLVVLSVFITWLII